MSNPTGNPAYALSLTLPLPFEAALVRVQEALAAEGFGVLWQMDVQATLKKKLDADVRPYTVLGACNPPLAHRAMMAETHIGLLLPCNALVQATDDPDVSLVSFLNPAIMSQIADSPAIAEVAADANARLERVVAALQS